MDNIIFFFNEKENSSNNEACINKMMEEFNQDTDTCELEPWIIHEDTENDLLKYFTKKNTYINDEEFYQEYTVKELLKICGYYSIDKHIRASKCKKNDIISTIIYFESLPENVEIVKKRHNMWAYITELLEDSKMKIFIIWD